MTALIQFYTIVFLYLSTMEMSIYKPPAFNQVAHLASNVPYWSRQYHVMYKACMEHNKAIQKVIDDNNANIEQIEARGAFNADETRFLENMKTLQIILSKKMEDLNKEAEFMDGLEKDLKEMSNNKKKDVEKTYKKYQNSRDKLTKKTVQVDAGKKAYHKTEFQIERLEIKQADEQFIGRVTKQIEALKKNTEAEFEAYEKKVVKWEAACKKAVELAEDYQFMYSKMETEKADVVIGSLAQWADLLQDTRQSGDNANTNTADIFKDIHSARVIEKAVSTTKTVKKQEIEMYERTERKDDLRKAVLADGVQTDVIRVTKNGALYKVLSPNDTKDAKQLKLKGGEFVKQILAVNTQGLIYCKIEHRLPFRRRKGFLLLTCICPGDVVDSSANNNTSDVQITSTSVSSSDQTSDDDHQSVADEGKSETSVNTYEDALNPFGDNDDNDADDARDYKLVVDASVDSYNPFGIENDDDPDGTRDASEDEIVGNASVASLNPFGNDDDDDGDDSFNVRENGAVGDASVDTLKPFIDENDDDVATSAKESEMVGNASVESLNPFGAEDDGVDDATSAKESEMVDNASVKSLNPSKAVDDGVDDATTAKESEIVDNASVESLNPLGADDDGVDDASSDVGDTDMVVDTNDETFNPFTDAIDD